MTTWHEIVVEGSEKVLRAFTLGFAAGHPRRDVMLFGADLDLAPSSLHERLAELFAAGPHHVLLAPVDTAVELARVLREVGDEVNLRVAGTSEVMRAGLPFSIEAFSAVVARDLRERLFAALPAGVQVEGLEESELDDPSVRGTELYAPTHAYTFTSRGTFRGPLPGVLEMQRRAQALEFVTTSGLVIETRAIPSS